MSSRLCALAIGIAATGCLGKPSVPTETHDAPLGDIGYDVASDAYQYTCTPIPSDFKIRVAPTIANVDRRDGSSAEDIVIWGRVTSSSAPLAYLIPGRTAFDPICYDRAFEFSTSQLLPLDVWVGEVTGDAYPDLAMYGRQTVAAGPQHEIRVFPGEATGTVSQTPLVRTFPTGSPFDNWGGFDDDTQEPVYMAATTLTGATPGSELFLGGLYNSKAAILVSPGPSLGSTMVASDTTNSALIGGDPVQDVFEFASGNPSQLVLVSQGFVTRVQSNGVRVSGNSQYAIKNSSPLASTQRRAVRFSREPLTGTGGTLFGVTLDGAAGYTIIQVMGTGSEPTVMAPLATTVIDPYATVDMALGNLDTDPKLELVAITDDTPSPPLLRAYTNLMINGADPVGYGFIHEATLPADYTILAVGDFDGLSSTPPQIVVFPAVVGKLPLCYQLVGTCFKACGSSTCVP